MYDIIDNIFEKVIFENCFANVNFKKKENTSIGVENLVFA